MWRSTRWPMCCRPALDRVRRRAGRPAQLRCSSPSSPGRAGRCWSRPGTRGRPRPPPGGRRYGSPMAAWRSGMALLAVQLLLQVLGSRHAEPAGAPRALAALAWARCRSGCCMAARRWSALFSGMPIAFALGGVATAVHARLHAGRLARYHRPERLRGTGQHHPADHPAVHPEGRGDRQVARRQGPLRRAAHLAAPGARRAWAWRW